MRLARLPRCSVRYYCAVLLRLSFDPQNLPRGPTRELRLIFLTVASQRSSWSPLVPGSQPHCAPLQLTLTACEHDEKVGGLRSTGSRLGARPEETFGGLVTLYYLLFVRIFHVQERHTISCLLPRSSSSQVGVFSSHFLVG